MKIKTKRYYTHARARRGGGYCRQRTYVTFGNRRSRTSKKVIGAFVNYAGQTLNSCQNMQKPTPEENARYTKIIIWEIIVLILILLTFPLMNWYYGC